MIQFKFFLDYSQEEKWLNQMARKGYELTGVSAWYTFKPCPPQDALIRIDNRFFRKQDDFINYCTLFEDSGWKHIAGSRYSGTQYFKRLDSTSAEDIFSDQFSKAERYHRLSQVWIYLILLSFICFGIVALNWSESIRAMGQPKLFYLTPGLWERTGDAFWRAFWFETPFALFRAALVYFYPFSLVVYTYLVLKARHLYLKEKSNDSHN